MIGEVETESNINEEIIEKWKSFQSVGTNCIILSQRIRLKLLGICAGTINLWKELRYPPILWKSHSLKKFFVFFNSIYKVISS